MTNTQHTPTPWRMERSFQGTDDSQFVITNIPVGYGFGDKDWMIFSDGQNAMWDGEPELADVQHANAAFIVGACNLHDELYGIAHSLAFWNQVSSAQTAEEILKELGPIIAKAKAVVDKAEKLS